MWTMENVAASYAPAVNAVEIFKLLGVFLGASLESGTVTWSFLLRLGLTPNKAKGGSPYKKSF